MFPILLLPPNESKAKRSHSSFGKKKKRLAPWAVGTVWTNDVGEVCLSKDSVGPLKMTGKKISMWARIHLAFVMQNRVTEKKDWLACCIDPVDGLELKQGKKWASVHVYDTMTVSNVQIQ